MKETGYKIIQEDKTFAVYNNGSVIAKGCIEKTDALQSIWQNEGKNPNETYIILNDVVTCIKAKA